MSHWTLAKVQILNPDIKLLRKVVEEIAAEIKGKVFDMPLMHLGLPAFPKELIGIESAMGCFAVAILENGRMYVLGINGTYKRKAEELAKEIEQRYVAHAVRAVAMELGFDVIESRMKDVLVIDLVRW